MDCGGKRRATPRSDGAGARRSFASARCLLRGGLGFLGGRGVVHHEAEIAELAGVVAVEGQEQVARAGDFLVNGRHEGVAVAVGLFEILFQLLGRGVEARGGGHRGAGGGPVQVLEGRRGGQGGVFGEDGGGQFEAFAGIAGDVNAGFSHRMMWVKWAGVGQHGGTIRRSGAEVKADGVKVGLHNGKVGLPRATVCLNFAAVETNFAIVRTNFAIVGLVSGGSSLVCVKVETDFDKSSLAVGRRWTNNGKSGHDYGKVETVLAGSASVWTVRLPLGRVLPHPNPLPPGEGGVGESAAASVRAPNGCERRDAKDAETTQRRKTSASLRVLCVSALKESSPPIAPPYP